MTLPSFGYGVGDFVAVGTLVTRIIQGLVESRDATIDCQSLIASLKSLETSIKTVRAVFDLAYGARATANAIKHQLDICEDMIKKFYANSKEYTEMLCNGKNKNRVIHELRKISWTMFKTGDIQRLQRDLAVHLQAIDLLVGTLSCEIVLGLQMPKPKPKPQSIPDIAIDNIDSGYSSPECTSVDENPPTRHGPHATGRLPEAPDDNSSQSKDIIQFHPPWSSSSSSSTTEPGWYAHHKKPTQGAEKEEEHQRKRRTNRRAFLLDMERFQNECISTKAPPTKAKDMGMVRQIDAGIAEAGAYQIHMEDVRQARDEAERKSKWAKKVAGLAAKVDLPIRKEVDAHVIRLRNPMNL